MSRSSPLALAAALAAFPARAAALDAASLQFTVPAPDPAQAGDVISLQALAVNTGNTPWAPGSYYWVGEVYDLDDRMIARTDQVSPPDVVQAGAIASISLPFHIPETMSGRRLYRVFLVKDSKTLIESDYKGFQVVEKEIPPPPEVVAYHMEGNVTTSFKDSSHPDGKTVTGATAFNTVGKIQDNSYLMNLYILHQPGNVFNPSIIVANFYAPWGTIYAGDISPNLGPLAVSGQGLRGVMLEQKKGPWDWDALGGRTVTSQAGTATANGRYARTLYAGKLGYFLLAGLKLETNAFVSSDEIGSLSSDPNSANFRGPNLVAQKNSGYGLDVSWEPVPKLKFLSAYQQNEYWADTSGAPVQDTAVRAEASWERKLFKLRAYVQRAGPNFVAFDNPGVVGDRMTYDAQFNAFPISWYNFSLGADQYQDNLAHNAGQTTTTERLLSTTHSFQLRTGTSLALNGSLNSALGNPSSVLDNQTTTVGLNVGQAVQKQHISFNVQNSAFRDATHLADDLDTWTEGLSASWKLPRDWGLTLGLTESDTQDRTNGSKRTSQSFGPSFSVPLRKDWRGQFWGTYTATRNTSPTLPADSRVISLNSEYTWTRDKHSNVTFGLGTDLNQDAVNAGNTYDELTASFRYSYTF